MAPSLREYWNTGDDGTYNLYGVYWRAMTFTTPAAGHTITSVKLFLYRTGSPGTVTVSIRATASGHPTGADLTSGTTNGDTLPTAAPYEWREITLTAINLSASTKYAIVVRGGTGSSNCVRWRTQSGNPYSEGNLEQSSDSGVTWAAIASQEGLFEVWGEDLVTYINVSDSGAGSDVLAMSAEVSAPDTGAGVDSPDILSVFLIDCADNAVGIESVDMSAEIALTETLVGADVSTVQTSVASSESGVGDDVPSIQNQLTETDEVVGSDEIPSLSVSLTVVESGAGVEVPGIAVGIPVSDSAHGSEVAVYPSASLTVSDSGLGLEGVTTPGTLTVVDEGKGAEFAWRTKPSSPMIDTLALPHVLSIKISDPATMSDKKIQGGTLPRRKMVGKPGRVVEVAGWSDSQAEIDALDALRDGVRRTFYHPSGDSFGVLVTGFEPSRTVDEYDRRSYRLSLVEAN